MTSTKSKIVHIDLTGDENEGDAVLAYGHGKDARRTQTTPTITGTTIITTALPAVKLEASDSLHIPIETACAATTRLKDITIHKSLHADQATTSTLEIAVREGHDVSKMLVQSTIDGDICSVDRDSCTLLLEAPCVDPDSPWPLEFPGDTIRDVLVSPFPAITSLAAAEFLGAHAAILAIHQRILDHVKTRDCWPEGLGDLTFLQLQPVLSLAPLYSYVFPHMPCQETVLELMAPAFRVNRKRLRNGESWYALVMAKLADSCYLCLAKSRMRVDAYWLKCPDLSPRLGICARHVATDMPYNHWHAMCETVARVLVPSTQETRRGRFLSRGHFLSRSRFIYTMLKSARMVKFLYTGKGIPYSKSASPKLADTDTCKQIVAAFFAHRVNGGRCNKRPSGSETDAWLWDTHVTKRFRDNDTRLDTEAETVDQRLAHVLGLWAGAQLTLPYMKQYVNKGKLLVRHANVAEAVMEARVRHYCADVAWLGDAFFKGSGKLDPVDTFQRIDLALEYYYLSVEMNNDTTPTADVVSKLTVFVRKSDTTTRANTSFDQAVARLRPTLSVLRVVQRRSSLTNCNATWGPLSAHV